MSKCEETTIFDKSKMKYICDCPGRKKLSEEEAKGWKEKEKHAITRIVNLSETMKTEKKPDGEIISTIK